MAGFGSVLNTFSDFLIYDERKGRVLHSRHLNDAQHYEVWRFQFNRLRPDLPVSLEKSHTRGLLLARSVIGFLREEQLRLHRLHNNNLRHEFKHTRNIEFYERTLDLISQSYGDCFHTGMYSWHDQLKTYDYIRKVVNKVQRYGFYGASGSLASKEQKAEFEEKLYQIFCSKLGVENP
jgi:hypothetical protein